MNCDNPSMKINYYQNTFIPSWVLFKTNIFQKSKVPGTTSILSLTSYAFDSLRLALYITSMNNTNFASLKALT